MKIKIENLEKIFKTKKREVKALRDINLEINNKEFFVFLGPSGSGKSTLLNIIAGLENPDSGRIYFNGKKIVDAENKIFTPVKTRNVAFVFQNYALYPHLSVFENIAFPLRIEKLKNSEIEKKVFKIAELLKIKELLFAKPRELSGGQKQRVAIGRAIVREPNVFLLDEPLSNLDAKLRSEMRVELKNLQDKLKITTIYVTHDQIEALTLGDKIAVIKDGRIIQVSSSDSLYNNPQNTFVAEFIGIPPMNILKREDAQKLKINTDKNFIGIRPEDIIILEKDKNKNILGKVIFMENIGKNKIYTLNIKNIKIKVLSDKSFKIGEDINILMPKEKIYFFEE